MGLVTGHNMAAHRTGKASKSIYTLSHHLLEPTRYKSHSPHGYYFLHGCGAPLICKNGFGLTTISILTTFLSLNMSSRGVLVILIVIRISFHLEAVDLPSLAVAF